MRTYRIQRVNANDSVPFSSLCNVVTESLCESTSEQLLALSYLIIRVRLASEAASIGVSTSGQRLAAVFLVEHELRDGDGVWRI